MQLLAYIARRVFSSRATVAGLMLTSVLFGPLRMLRSRCDRYLFTSATERSLSLLPAKNCRKCLICDLYVVTKHNCQIFIEKSFCGSEFTTACRFHLAEQVRSFLLPGIENCNSH